MLEDEEVIHHKAIEKHMKYMRWIMAAIAAGTLITGLATTAKAANYNEDHFNKEVCSYIGGASNYSTYVDDIKLKPDCITDKEVFEADWGDKIYEGIGQAVVYAEATGKEGKIIIYIRMENEKLRRKDERKLRLVKTLFKSKCITDGKGSLVIEANRNTGEWTHRKCK